MGCNLGRLVKRIRFRSLAQVTQEFVTHLGHPASKQTVQRRLHGHAIYRRVAVQKPDIGLENRPRRRRWCTRTLNWTVLNNWSCLLFFGESRFNLAYCDGSARVWRTAGEKYIPECLRIVDRTQIVSVMVWGSLAITVLAIWSFLMKTWIWEHCQKPFLILYNTYLATEIIHSCFNMIRPTRR